MVGVIFLLITLLILLLIFFIWYLKLATIKITSVHCKSMLGTM